MNPLFRTFAIACGIIFSPLTIAVGTNTDNAVIFQIIQSQMFFNNSTVETATIISPASHADSYGVALKLKAIAAHKFIELTEENIGKQANIMLDGKVVSSTMIRGKLAGEFTMYGLTKTQAKQFIKSLDLKNQSNAKDTPNPFLGTWKLVSVTRDTVPPSKVTNSFGEQPSGFLNYADDGRMMVIIVQNGRPTPQDKIAHDEEALALYRTFNSYAGTYTIKDDHIIHHIDISWNQKWTNTDQIRYYQFVDDHLILSLLPTKENDQVVVDSLTWEKVSPAIDPESLEQAVIANLNKTKNEINTHGKAAVVDKLVKNNTEIFVLNYDGTFLSSPAHPEFIGTNQLNYQDTSGAFVVREEIEKAKAGGGWLNGRWRFNPDTQEYGCRKIYIMPIKEEYLIGSWYFYPFNKEMSKAEQQAACGSTL